MTMFRKLLCAAKAPGYLLAGDPFVSTNTLAQTTIGKIQMVATLVFALVLAVTGLVYAFAGQELKSKIKKKWLDVGIAIFIVYGCVMVVTFGINFAKTGGFN